jgi:hypothetical protein
VILEDCDPSGEQAIAFGKVTDSGFKRYHAPGVGDAHGCGF